jgi:hypothetical protein
MVNSSLQFKTVSIALSRSNLANLLILDSAKYVSFMDIGFLNDSGLLVKTSFSLSSGAKKILG